MHSVLVVSFGIIWRGVTLSDSELSRPYDAHDSRFSLTDGVCSLIPLSGGLDSCATGE